MFFGGALGVMVIIVRNGLGERVRILDEAVCISHCTLPPAMNK